MRSKKVAFVVLDSALIDDVKRLEVDTGLSFAELLRMLISNYQTVVADKEVEVI